MAKLLTPELERDLGRANRRAQGSSSNTATRDRRRADSEVRGRSIATVCSATRDGHYALVALRKNEKENSEKGNREKEQLSQQHDVPMGSPAP
jgi:hypothetical protein